MKNELKDILEERKDTLKAINKQIEEFGWLDE